jgi:dCMP deaminase
MRPSRESLFLDISDSLARMGTCSRKGVGCVVVVSGRIVATGWNGALPGARHCDHTDGGDMENGHCSNAIHAEANAVAQAASTAVSLAGGTAYTSVTPCRHCYQLLRASGVSKIIYRGDYRMHPLVEASGVVRREINFSAGKPGP